MYDCSVCVGVHWYSLSGVRCIQEEEELIELVLKINSPVRGSVRLPGSGMERVGLTLYSSWSASQEGGPPPAVLSTSGRGGM